MALDMWFKEDIGNVLDGIELAAARMGSDLPMLEAEAFRNGFRAALDAAAVSFGIRPYVPEVRQPQLRDVTPRPLRLTGGTR